MPLFAGSGPGGPDPRGRELGDLDAAAGLLELLPERVGLSALDALLDRLGGLVDERLRFLEAETGRRAHDLDHLDLLVTGSGQCDGERRLLLGGVLARAGASARARCRRSRG